jgi:hypothetical protein
MAVSDPWQAIKIREFEHVVTGPSMSLLRVSGKAQWRRGSEHRPTLVVDDGVRQHRFEPIQAPPDRHGVLRAAYAVPSALIGLARKFWLQHEGGARTVLPAPDEGVARVVRDQGGRPEPAPGPSTPETAAESELPLARERITALELRIAELEGARDRDLRTSAEATAEAEARVAAAEGRAEAAREHAASVAATAESLERLGAELEQTLQARDARIAALEGELADATPAREMLERELAKMRAGRANRERELDQSRDQLRLMAFERDELSRQATAFDGIAVKARERALQAETTNERMTETLRDLETWRGELERRLAETTSELGAAKATQETDERELVRLRSALAEAEMRGNVPGRLGNGSDGAPDSSQTLAAQAAEIEHLAAELAALRSRVAREDEERSRD